MLRILRITCEVTDGQQTGGKFDSKITCLTGIQKCRAHTAEDDSSHSMGANQNNVNILDYFRLNANNVADEASRSIIQKMYSKFSNVFTGIGCFEGTFKLRVNKGSCPYQTPGGRGICTKAATQKGTRQATETAGNHTIGYGQNIIMLQQLHSGAKG